jgi:malate dehydrogenase
MKVSILGAGDLGATIAQKLADRDWPGEVLLVDSESGPPEGKALDLLEANPVLASGTTLRGSRDLEAIQSSNYIVVADLPGLRTGGRDQSGVGTLLEQIGRLAAESVIVVAADDCPSLLALAHSSGKVAPQRIVGTYPAALASTWRHYLGRALGCSAQDVSVSLLGAPPERGLYHAYSSLAGRAVEDLLPIAEFKQVEREVSRRTSPGPRNLASAAVTVLRGMVAKNGTVHSAYVWAGGAYGGRDLFLCAPAILGPDGLQRVIETPLDPAQRVTVDRSIDYLSRIQMVAR